MKLPCRARVSGALLVMAALAIPVFATSAKAQERTNYKDIYGNILGAVGFGADRDPIDYAPRPPIVVPPNNELPPIDEGARRAAGFPDDPDVNARRKALVDPRRPIPPGEASGTSARSYLIEPPAAYFDASTVAATGQNVDRGEAEPKKVSRHHKRQVNAQ